MKVGYQLYMFSLQHSLKKLLPGLYLDLKVKLNGKHNILLNWKRFLSNKSNSYISLKGG